MKTNEEKKVARRLPPRQVGRMVETVVGCKWSLTVLDLVHGGVNRPGAMVRSVDGLTTKVLNDCLRRLIEFGILRRHAYPEVPPRVEYTLTPFGEQFSRTLETLDALEESLAEAHARARADAD